MNFSPHNCQGASLSNQCLCGVMANRRSVLIGGVQCIALPVRVGARSLGVLVQTLATQR